MENNYVALQKQIFSNGGLSIVPIRMEDRYTIMKWRNEQIFHLRQHKILTTEDQDHYFKTSIADLFGKEQPDQLLFSYLDGEKCIGYGGLVHINWVDKNAEISFITDTTIINEPYVKHMSTFLSLIEQVAFNELEFHKLFTYAFDVRPYIYPILEQSGFKKEAVLTEHCFFNEKFKDVIIHSKFNSLA